MFIVALGIPADLAERGLDFGVQRLYVLDGSKALVKAVRHHAGEAALIQRCQLHKRRNVLNHLPDEHQPLIEQKLVAAWAMTDYWQAEQRVQGSSTTGGFFGPSGSRSQGAYVSG